MKQNNKVTSTEIKRALQGRNPKDYYLTEVKNGGTYTPSNQGLLIFDAVHIKRSWTNPCITIYEIKVSRGDFLQDNKWKLYLQYCNQFYFVVPKGMIDKNELPGDIGLIYYNPDTGALVTKQKSKYRECENPDDMYKYIIYSRLEENQYPFYNSKVEYAKDYIEDKAYKKCIGRTLGSKMAKDLGEAHERLMRLKDSEEKVEFYEDVLKLMRDNHLWTYGGTKAVLKELSEALNDRKSIAGKDLDRIEQDLNLALQRIKRIRGDADEETQ